MFLSFMASLLWIIAESHGWRERERERFGTIQKDGKRSAANGWHSDIEILSAVNPAIANQSPPFHPQIRSDQLCSRRFSCDIPALFEWSNVSKRLWADSMNYSVFDSPYFIRTHWPFDKSAKSPGIFDVLISEGALCSEVVKWLCGVPWDYSVIEI